MVICLIWCCSPAGSCISPRRGGSSSFGPTSSGGKWWVPSHDDWRRYGKWTIERCCTCEKNSYFSILFIAMLVYQVVRDWVSFHEIGLDACKNFEKSCRILTQVTPVTQGPSHLVRPLGIDHPIGIMIPIPSPVPDRFSLEMTKGDWTLRPWLWNCPATMIATVLFWLL